MGRSQKLYSMYCTQSTGQSVEYSRSWSAHIHTLRRTIKDSSPTTTAIAIIINLITNLLTGINLIYSKGPTRLTAAGDRRIWGQTDLFIFIADLFAGLLACLPGCYSASGWLQRSGSACVLVCSNSKRMASRSITGSSLLGFINCLLFSLEVPRCECGKRKQTTMFMAILWVLFRGT